MLAGLYFPRLSSESSECLTSDIRIAVQKNNLWAQTFYRSLDPVKRRLNGIRCYLEKKLNDFSKICFMRHRK